MFGVFLEKPEEFPVSAQSCIASQLSVAEPRGPITEYARSEARWRHAPRIRQQYGYRTYTDRGVVFRLSCFLYTLCWTVFDRPSALFERAVAWLLEGKVLLSGKSVLERAVAKVRVRATNRLHQLLIGSITPEQRIRLDSLIVVPEGKRRSPLDRLRDGPHIQSGREISRALGPLEEIRIIASGLQTMDGLPPGKVTALARFVSSARAQAVSRLPDDRRAATLPALLAGLDLGAAPAGRPLLEAIDYLRVVQSGRKRAGPPLTAFTRKIWLLQLKSTDGSVDLAVYKLCVLDELRRAIR